MEKIINTTAEEVLEMTEDFATADISRKNLGKKVTIGVLAVAALGAVVKIGYNYYKKVKKGKTELVEENPTEIFDDVDDFDDTIE